MIHEHSDELVVHGLWIWLPPIVQLQHLLVPLQYAGLVLMVVKFLDLTLLLWVMVQSFKSVTPQLIRHSGAIWIEVQEKKRMSEYETVITLEHAGFILKY